MPASPRITWLNPILLAGGAVLIGSFGLAATSGSIPIRGMIVQLGAVAAIVLTLLKWRGPGLPRIVSTVLAAVLAVPLMQLIPLPPHIWQSLPGREIATEIADLAGGSQWRPISLDPNATFRSFLALLPPLAMFLASCQLQRNEHNILIWIFIYIGLASAVLGGFQILLDDKSAYLFWDASIGRPTGLFGNRNHQAIFMALCALFTYYMICDGWDNRNRKKFIVYSLLIILFVGAVFATQSRSGVAILLMVFLAAPACINLNIEPKRLLPFLILFFLCVSLFFAQSHVVLNALERFGKSEEDGRYNIWPDVIFSVKYYFPFGSGAGTFTEAFQPFEDFNQVSRYYIPRAHNDYLELLLEIGIFAVPLLLAIFGLSFRRVWSLINSGNTQSARFGKAIVLAILALALHSIVDYPIQTVALGSALGMFLGILFADRTAESAQSGPQESRSDSAGPHYLGRDYYRLAMRAGLLVAATLLTAKVALVGVADAAFQAHHYSLAAKAWPGSVDAMSGWSEELLAKGLKNQALEIASQSLQLSSQNSFSLRSAARAAEAKNLPELANSAWTVAAKLGWRDGFVQSWVYEQAMNNRDYAAATRAADAMARTDFQRELALKNLAKLTKLAGGRRAVAESLIAKPPWSKEFFKLLMSSQEEEGILASFIAELARLDAVPDDASAFPLLERLLVEGNSKLVVAIWRKQHASMQGDPRQGLVDNKFDVYSGNSLKESFFGWKSSADPGVQIEIEQDQDALGATRLRVDTSARAPLSILNQMLALPPGAYRFEFAMSAVHGSAQDFYWEVRCRGLAKDGKRVLANNRYGLFDGKHGALRTLTFVVPDVGCAAQTISLLGKGTLDEGSGAEFSNLRILRAEAGANDRLGDQGAGA